MLYLPSILGPFMLHLLYPLPSIATLRYTHILLHTNCQSNIKFVINPVFGAVYPIFDES